MLYWNKVISSEQLGIQLFTHKVDKDRYDVNQFLMKVLKFIIGEKWQKCLIFFDFVIYVVKNKC